MDNRNDPLEDIFRRVRDAPALDIVTPSSSPPHYTPSSFGNPVRHTVRRWVIVAFVILFVFICGIFFGRALNVSGNPSQVTNPDNNSQSTSIPTQISYPSLVSTYQGTVQNTTYGGTATLALTSIVQNQGEISGNVVIGPGLNGSGPFTGTIGSDGSVNFTDTPPDWSSGTITFSGQLNADGSLGGTYLVSNSEQGTWQTTPN